MVTLSGERYVCDGRGKVTVQTMSGALIELDVLVSARKPLNFSFILGMNGVRALRGVSVSASNAVNFGIDAVAPAAPVAAAANDVISSGAVDSSQHPGRCNAAVQPDPTPTVEAPDYTVDFDPAVKTWTMKWKWTDDAEPECLHNTVAQYDVTPDARREFDDELTRWVENGWLVPYDESELGPPRGLVPLMAVQQRNKSKVRPVLDYRELNDYLTTHTADADVCADQLRRWRRHGSNVAVVDLRHAYLQIHIDRQLWPFQTVLIGDRRYCLTRLGFGLSVAPLAMRAVIREVLARDPDVNRAVLPYADDLLVNEDVVSAERVVAHLRDNGLECKPPQRAADGARLLGLHVSQELGRLVWRRDNEVGPPPAELTRRAVFSWCGRLIAHMPVCGWLRPAAAWLKRRVNDVTRGWDDVTSDETLQKQISHVAARVAAQDPAHGPWNVQTDRAVVWVDASSVATGVVVETSEGDVIEDGSWLRKDDSTHINVAELNAAVRGINMAIAWRMRNIELRTDSSTVHRWVDDALSGRARLRTKAHGEMLIRRRVDIIRQLVSELGLVLSVTLVRSAENRADALSRVPRDWVHSDSSPAAPETAAGCGAAETDSAVSSLGDSASSPVTAAEGAENRAACAGSERTTADPVTPPGDSVRTTEDQLEDQPAPNSSADITEAIVRVHDRAGHPGIRRTLYFARRDVARNVTRAQVRNVVSRCDACRAIDPAPVKWTHGSLEVADVWRRLAIDVTHYRGQSYLSVVDCGPSRFCLWRHLRHSDAEITISQLEQIFFERGAPVELLCDNDTIFRSRSFAVFVAKWGIRLRFRAVHEPAGNSIVERNHRTVKVIAARKQCSVAEAVHLYNVTPREGSSAASAPASVLYRYQVRDNVRPSAVQPVTDPPPRGDGEMYSVGDPVWVRRRGTRCVEMSQPGTVSNVISEQVVEVNGVPWHVRNLRRRNADAVVDEPSREGDDEGDVSGNDSLIVTVPERNVAGESGRTEEDGEMGEDAPAEGDDAAGDHEQRVLPRRGERDRRPVQLFQSSG